MRIVREVLLQPGPVITAFGADLLYEGLLLEIDALAVRDSQRSAISARAGMTPLHFPPAWQVGAEVYFSVAGAASGAITNQLTAVLRSIKAILSEAKADPRDLVKLTAFYVSDGDAETEARALRLGIRACFPAPVLTLVQVAALAVAGQKLQIDGVCSALET